MESNDKIYITRQDIEFVKEDGQAYYTCEFLDQRKTGLGFKATRSELALCNSEKTNLYGKLEECFEPVENYKEKIRIN